MVYTVSVTISQFTPVYMSTVATIATKKERLLACNWRTAQTKIRLLVTAVGLADQIYSRLVCNLDKFCALQFPYYPSPMNAPIH